jgi:hypothetical protein
MNLFSKTYHKYLNLLVKNLVPTKEAKNYIVFKNSLAYSEDIQKDIKETYKKSRGDTRVLVIYFNFLWKPILDLAQFLNLRSPKETKEPNWLSPDDINNIFYLENFEKVKEGKYLVFPFPGKLFEILNKIISNLPLIKELSLITYQIYRPLFKPKKYSVSIIIPARNESGNIVGLISKLPKFNTKTEVIFVEGHSKDNTYEKIINEIKQNKRKDIASYVFKQNGIGKNDAVKLGFEKAKNDILIVLDADLTVKPKELKKFYDAICEGKSDLVIGTRLVYPMEKQAMRLLNYFGNKMFSILFSFIIDQKIKDTLCGTKAILKSNYLKIKSNQRYFGNFDPFGDFDLIFGSAKLNFKITEVPVRYGQRKYGQTNIDRFRHGLLLLRMVYLGLLKLKFV